LNVAVCKPREDTFVRPFDGARLHFSLLWFGRLAAIKTAIAKQLPLFVGVSSPLYIDRTLWRSSKGAFSSTSVMTGTAWVRKMAPWFRHSASKLMYGPAEAAP
jgi:hypothetical protein